MSTPSSLPRQLSAAVLLGTLVAGAASAATLPSFSFNPGAVGLAGSAFSANNLIISDYSTITNNGATFTDVGYLSIMSAQLDTGAPAVAAGLNSSYGLFIAFNGSGVNTVPGNPSTSITAATFTSLSYTLYGYNGSAAFGFDANNQPTTTATGAIALATGTLINGSAVTYPNGDGSFTPAGSAKATLNIVPGMEAFFQSPGGFYTTISTAFSNTSSQVEILANGFLIRQGGGTVNFANPVPEPSTYAMLAAGLGVIGWVARRRKQR